MPTAPDQNAPTVPDNAEQSANAPITMITSVAQQITDDTGLTCTHEIQDLVIITYVGLLDSPPPDRPSTEHLLNQCRRNLIIWAWEQGCDGQDLPTRTHRHTT
jgi:hypothetical protein